MEVVSEEWFPGKSIWARRRSEELSKASNLQVSTQGKTATPENAMKYNI